MKIGVSPLNAAVESLNQLREKRDGSRQQQGGQTGQEKKQQDSGEQELSSDEMKEKLTSAVESFSSDAQAKANGLSASLAENAGPGLKIVLKDISGNVVRQFTGEEFLKLRGTSAGTFPKRGKILDQKY